MDNYIEKCEKAEEIQELWKPKVGDYVWRKYTFFGEELDKQIWDEDKRTETIILTYASDIDGYFHATKDGKTRIFNSYNEAHKATCIWLPTEGQILEKIMNSKKKIIEIDMTKYCQAENFGITIYKQFDYYEIVLRNSPSEFDYNWINWKEKTLIECLLDVCMFLLRYKVWGKDKREWITKLWDRNKKEFHEIKKMYEVKDE